MIEHLTFIILVIIVIQNDTLILALVYDTLVGTGDAYLCFNRKLH